MLCSQRIFYYLHPEQKSNFCESIKIAARYE